MANTHETNSATPSNSNVSNHAEVNQLGIWDMLILLGQKKFILFGIPLFIAFITGLHCFFSPAIYSSTARVLPPQYNQYNVNGLNNQLGGESTLGNASLTVKNPSDLYVGILHSTTILDALIKRFNLRDYYHESVQDDARKKLLKNTDVSVGKDGILLIVVEDESPQFAANLANAYVEELYHFSRDLAQKEAMRRSSFYESVLTKAKEKLKASDIALMEVEKRTGYTSLSGQDEAIVEGVSVLQEQISKRRTELQSLQTFATDNHPDVRRLRSEIAGLEKQLGDSMQGKGPQAQSVKAQTTKAIDTKPTPEKLAEVVKKLSDNTQVSTKSTVTDDGSIPFVSLSDAPNAMLEHKQKLREVEYWKSMVEMLGRIDEMGKIDETRDLSLIQLLDKAVPSHYKSKPRIFINVVVIFIATFFLCFIYIIFSQWLSYTSANNKVFAEKLQKIKNVWSLRKTKTSAPLT